HFTLSFVNFALRFQLRSDRTELSASFYIAKIGKSFLLLHGFAKKQQQTPKKEIKTALKRLRDYESKN
ncbi:hypothetical protein COT75_01225, partial [Candidatus Beckwithbacteria bacterium CG10_big_fil_rev_8_21_14_0_10_34_10]